HPVALAVVSDRVPRTGRGARLIVRTAGGGDQAADRNRGQEHPAGQDEPCGCHRVFPRGACCRRRTTKFSSGAGWKEVMPRKAVLPAPSAATAGSAMLFLWNR